VCVEQQSKREKGQKKGEVVLVIGERGQTEERREEKIAAVEFPLKGFLSLAGPTRIYPKMDNAEYFHFYS